MILHFFLLLQNNDPRISIILKGGHIANPNYMSIHLISPPAITHLDKSRDVKDVNVPLGFSCQLPSL